MTMARGLTHLGRGNQSLTTFDTVADFFERLADRQEQALKGIGPAQLPTDPNYLSKTLPLASFPRCANTVSGNPTDTQCILQSERITA